MEAASPVMVVKKIVGHRLRVDGTQHSGWRPVNSIAPLPMSARDVQFNLVIQFDGFGYLLCYASDTGELYGDTWHETLDEATDQAARWFGVTHDQWQGA